MKEEVVHSFSKFRVISDEALLLYESITKMVLSRKEPFKSHHLHTFPMVVSQGLSRGEEKMAMKKKVRNLGFILGSITLKRNLIISR